MADLNVSVPNFNQSTSVDDKVEMLVQYAYKLNEQLRYVLNNLDIDSFGAETAEQIRTASAGAKKISEIESETKSLRQSIIYNAREISSMSEALMTTLTNSLTAISDEYILKEDAVSKTTFDGFGQTIEANYKQYINSVFTGSEEVTEYTGFIKVGLIESEGVRKLGITIATSDDGFKTVYTSEKLSFLLNNIELAYFANDELYINIIRTGEIRLGNFVFSQSGKKITLKYAGG